MPQVAVVGPLDEGDFRDQPWFDPPESLHVLSGHALAPMGGRATWKVRKCIAPTILGSTDRERLAMTGQNMDNPS